MYYEITLNRSSGNRDSQINNYRREKMMKH